MATRKAKPKQVRNPNRPTPPFLNPGKYFVVPDVQAPYHDQRTVDVVCEMLEANRGYFTGSLWVGDTTDQDEISRWSKGRAKAFMPTFWHNVEIALTNVYEPVLDALGTTENFEAESNHNRRFEEAVALALPSLADGINFTLDKVMGYNTPSIIDSRFGKSIPLTYVRHPWEFAPGWTLVHGDKAGYSTIAGGTALAIARKYRKSVVCGHTHRAALKHENTAMNGIQTSSLKGLEVGNWMDLSSSGAEYMPGGAANWQQAFAVIHIDENLDVYPELVLVEHGSFLFNGQIWKSNRRGSRVFA